MKKLIGMLIAMTIVLAGCDKIAPTEPKSTTGVSKASAEVEAQADGYTVEQGNIRKRYALENTPGSIKHLYVLSAYSGQVIVYSTVKGKVTSSGKRLTPYSVACMDGQAVWGKHNGFSVNIGGRTKATGEVLQDDGTYGHSIPYLFWFDVQGRYHQHYVSGGQLIHISDQPLVVKDIIINMEITNEQ